MPAWGGRKGLECLHVHMEPLKPFHALLQGLVVASGGLSGTRQVAFGDLRPLHPQSFPQLQSRPWLANTLGMGLERVHGDGDEEWAHNDTSDNDPSHDDTSHNDTSHSDTIHNDIGHSDTSHNDTSLVALWLMSLWLASLWQVLLGPWGPNGAIFPQDSYFFGALPRAQPT